MVMVLFLYVCLVLWGWVVLIVSSLDGLRVLFSCAPRRYYRVVVWVSPVSDAVLPPFSGKVVKSLLIKANPLLGKVFGRDGAYTPKPIHITPLGYIDDNGSPRFLWKTPDKKGAVAVRAGYTYFFRLGFDETIESMVFEALHSLDGVELFNTKWYVSGLEAETVKLPTRSPGLRLDDATAVKVMLRTPNTPLDPYKKTMYKRFLPLPSIMFAYNAGEITRILQRGPDYWRVLDLLNLVLTETHHVWDTVKKIHYLYDDKKPPALIGYIKYMVNQHPLKENPALKLLVENILEHATIMGTGTSRANGLGHVEIKVEKQT